MTANPLPETEGATDADLVTRSLEGDRDAFAVIVARHQALICSLAYSATGSLGESQDLAQETFLTAWKHLRLLRERHKLRPWLSGIARRLIGKARRKGAREPIHAAEPLETANQTSPDTLQADEPPPCERVMSREEEAILWRSIERIPETYREPLVLYYRQNQSVERVAAALGLTEDAVKQRLSRGRKMLQEEVAAFVEGALARTSPGRAFTLGVLAALPAFAASASAAGLGVTVAKAGAGTGAAAAALNSLAGPLTGFVSTYVGYRMSMEGAASERERRLIRRFYGILSVMIVAPFAVVGLAVWVRSWAIAHPALSSVLLTGVSTLWIPAVAGLLLWTRRRIRELTGLSTARGSAEARPAVFEYRSKARLAGLPLLHIRFGGNWASMEDVVKAWIAIGDTAVGVLFAFGGIALAPVSVGGFAAGGIVFGGFGAGALCYAGFALGIWAVGGLASGLHAIGGCATGWTAAVGGVAVAREFALGGLALAPHANDEMANSFTRSSAFFQYAFLLVTKWLWPTLLLSALPSVLLWRAARKRRLRTAWGH